MGDANFLFDFDRDGWDAVPENLLTTRTDAVRTSI
jgi:hypothetical protein